MSKTINFYNIAIFKNGIKTDIDLLRFIDQIAGFNWDQKVRRIDNNLAAMFPMHLNETYRDKRIIPFGKFRRDYKPFLGNISNSALRAIQNDDDVVELVTMVFDQRYRTAVLDFNIQGLKAKDIEAYFNSFFHRIEGEEWEVKFVPVKSAIGRENIDRSRQIRYLEIKLKLDRYNNNILNQGMEVDNDDSRLILNVLDSFNANRTNLDAKTLKLEFNVGQGQQATMNLDTVKQLLDLLNLDAEYIESVKVKFRDNATNKLDTIDLKNVGKQYKDKILENDDIKNPGSEYVGHTVLVSYHNYEGTLSSSHREFLRGMITVEFPRLNREPRPEHRVEIE